MEALSEARSASPSKQRIINEKINVHYMVINVQNKAKRAAQAQASMNLKHLCSGETSTFARAYLNINSQLCYKNIKEKGGLFSRIS